MNKEAIFHRSSPQKHAKFHVITIREAEFHFPGERPQSDGHQDKGADFLVTSRVFDLALIHDRPVALDGVFRLPLQRVNGETHPFLALAAFVNLETASVQARGARTGVYFGLDPLNPQVGDR